MSVDGHSVDDRVDFFVSYTGCDHAWAVWMAWILEDAGYRVLVQAWDFGVGAHFVAEMHRAVQRADRTIAVLSQAYQASPFATREWQAAFADDPEGLRRKLLLARVEGCPREGLLRQVVSVDLFGVDRGTARDRLLASARGVRGKPDREPPFPEAAEPRLPRRLSRFQVPPPRNPAFTGREAQLAVLRERLGAGPAAAPQALHGLAGVGKTQLAIEYAYRHVGDYDLVWWVPSDEPAVAVAALADLAEALGVGRPGAADESADAAVAVLRDGGAGRWLVVADNVDAPSGLWGLVRATGTSGHLLVTSRHPGWGAVAQLVEVDVFPRSEAIALLRERAPRVRPAEADAVADLLGDLPLAVDQAGVWLDQSGMDVTDYLNAVRERTHEVLALSTPFAYPAPVAATWTAAVDALDDPAAVLLLQLWAFLGPGPIPRGLVGERTAGALPGGCPAEWSPLWTALTTDTLARGAAVSKVWSLGLIRLVRDVVVMHRVVAAALRDHIGPAGRAAMPGLARAAIRALAPDPELPASWADWARLYPHVLATLPRSPTEPAARVVLATCTYLDESGNDRAALELALTTHQQWREAAPDHRDTLAVAALLGRAMRGQGEHTAARSIQQDLLARRRRLLGDDHRDTLTAAADLAHTLWELHEYNAACAIQRDVLERRRLQLGEDHHTVLLAASNLSHTLWALGERDAARTIQQDVLVRSSRRLGDDHPHTLTAAANLGYTLCESGDPGAARAIQQVVLDRSRRLFGDDHPRTLTAANNLSHTLRALGERDAACTIQQDVFVRSRRRLGKDHPQTLTAGANLACTLSELGKYSIARALQQDVHARSRRRLGDDHVDSLTAAHNLAHTLWSLGERDRARSLMAEVIGRRGRVLGAAHPATVDSTMWLRSWNRRWRLSWFDKDPALAALR
jgi:hypothetical protein